jgi:cytochrome b pre-mRNA-processing protein 3
MSILSALRRAIGGTLPPPGPADALYAAVVAEARRPAWYLAGQVPDTLDGRFDMVALVHSLVLIRLEDEGGAPDDAAPMLCAQLTERFITDMDGTLRQDGVGDQVVGKHIGRMVAALGGRLGTYRDARADDALFGDGLRRNLWRGQPVDDDAVAWVVARSRRLARRLEATPLAALIEGHIGPDA